MDRRSWLDPLAALLLLLGAAGRLAAAPGSVPASAPLASENWEARTLLQETIFAPVLDAAAHRASILDQEQGAARVSFQADSEGDALYLIFANQQGSSYPLAGTGTFIIKRSLKDGTFLQAKVFVQDDAGSFLRLFPQGDRTVMDIYLYGEPFQTRVELPVSFDRLLTSPLSRIVGLTQGSVDWPEVFPARPQEGDRRLAHIVHLLRTRLPRLRDRDDGAMDAFGRLVLISTGQPASKGSGGFNCSGFAKWVVDGFFRPLTGRYLDIEVLRQQSLDQRRGRWTGPFEEERDPLFGLDWTRNLARDLAQARDGDLPGVTDLDVRDVGHFAFLKDAGYRLAELRPLLYFLARRDPGMIYLGSVNSAGLTPATAGAPALRQHHHVVVLFPYFDAQGEFRLVVMGRNVETSPESLARRYPGEFIYLVRLDSTGSFVPPAIE